MKIKVYCTNIFVFWISMLCVHFDGCAAGWCYKCLLPLFSLQAAPGGGEGEKTLLACSWQRAALDRLLSSSLQKPFLRLLRCLYFRKSFGRSGQDLCACGIVVCVGKRAREAQGRARADTCCLQPSCGAGGHSWGWLGQVRPSSRPWVWGAPALGVGFCSGWGAGGRTVWWEGPGLRWGRAWPAASWRQWTNTVSVPLLGDKNGVSFLSFGVSSPARVWYYWSCALYLFRVKGVLPQCPITGCLSLARLWLMLCLGQLARALLRAPWGRPAEEPGRGLVAATGGSAAKAVPPGTHRTAAGEPLAWLCWVRTEGTASRLAWGAGCHLAANCSLAIFVLE